jgi:hypothetical protein
MTSIKRLAFQQVGAELDHATAIDAGPLLPFFELHPP